MKRESILLLALFVFIAGVGFASRRPERLVPQVNIQPTPRPTAVYRWGEIEIEPFLYAPPLGTFTPAAPVTIYEFPYGTQTVGELPAGDAAAFTSEYRREGDIWLCVMWNVDETIASWECTGWVLAESAEDSHGAIDREYENEPMDMNKAL